MRDTAYQSLLKSRRQQIHGRIAAALEAEFAEIAEAEPETVAQHYTLAGLAAEAVPWWLKAGQRAMTRSANREAAAHFAKGLELVASLPASETRLQAGAFTADGNGLGPDPRQRLGPIRRSCRRFRRRGNLPSGSGTRPSCSLRCAARARCRTISGDLRAAETLAMQCQTLGTGTRTGYPAIPATCWKRTISSGASTSISATTRPARRMPSYGLATYDYERHRHLAWGYTGHDPGVCCRSFSRTDALHMRQAGPERSSSRAKPSPWPSAIRIRSPGAGADGASASST